MKTFNELKCCTRGILGHGFGVLVVLLLFASSVFALQDGASRTPPMGFNTWNYFGCNNINETNVFGVAKAMLLKHAANWEGKSLSLADVGYQFVNLDDCWHSTRAADGTPQWNTTKFPHGLPWLADTIHKMGLKMGIYTDCGTNTCAGFFGSYGYETIDANTYVKWGMDYLKDDWCSIPSGYSNQAGCATLYSRMGHALVNAANAAGGGRRIVFSLCQWGNYNVWSWADSCGHLWRISGDITASWNSMLQNFHTISNNQLWKYTKPGAWNDPDMLEIGNGSLTAVQNQAHMDLWCIAPSPLLMGNNTITMSEAVFTVLSNREVIAIDQDSLGAGGRLVRTVGNVEIWAKKLKSIDTVANRTFAVVLLNTGSSSTSATVNWSDIGEATTTRAYLVRDLWSHTNVATAATASYTVTVPATGTVHLRFGPASGVGISPSKLNVAELKEQIKTRTLAGNDEIFVPEANSTLQIFDIQGKQLAFLRTSEAGWCTLSRSTPAARGTCLVRLTTSSGVIAEKIDFVR